MSNINDNVIWKQGHFFRLIIVSKFGDWGLRLFMDLNGYQAFSHLLLISQGEESRLLKTHAVRATNQRNKEIIYPFLHLMPVDVSAY